MRQWRLHYCLMLLCFSEELTKPLVLINHIIDVTYLFNWSHLSFIRTNISGEQPVVFALSGLVRDEFPCTFTNWCLSLLSLEKIVCSYILLAWNKKRHSVSCRNFKTNIFASPQNFKYWAEMLQKLWNKLHLSLLWHMSTNAKVPANIWRH